MAWITGVDGCRGGWFVVLRELPGAAEPVHHRLPCFEDVLRLPEKPEVIAVDIPIGLLDHAVHGGRECDQMARELLGALRARSVFSPPVRGALPSETFGSALAANRESSAAAIGISQQCFGLFRKLREVDAVMTSDLQRRVREVHPELCFYELNGRVPMPNGKKSSQGRAEREQLLLQAGFTTVAAAIG